MKALRWHGRGDISIDEIPEPVLRADDDVILEIEATGICGSDKEEVDGGPIAIPVDKPHPATGVAAPITLGHEIVGRVVAVGARAQVPVGTRVVPTPVIWCGECVNCTAGAIARCETLAVVGLSADGGLASFVRVRGTQCVAVPDDMARDRAVLVEPYAVAVHALAGQSLAQRRVAIVGFGSVGACVADVAIAAGAASVVAIDPDPAARRRAAARGIDAMGPGAAGEVEAALVCEASGASAGLATAITAAVSGGTVIAVGLRRGDVSIPLPTLIYRELTIHARVGHDLRDMATAVDGLAEGSLGAESREIEEVDLEAARDYLIGHAQAGSPSKVMYIPGS